MGMFKNMPQRLKEKEEERNVAVFWAVRVSGTTGETEIWSDKPRLFNGEWIDAFYAGRINMALPIPYDTPCKINMYLETDYIEVARKKAKSSEAFKKTLAIKQEERDRQEAREAEREAELQRVLSQSIDWLETSVRLGRALRENGYLTVRDIVATTKSEILSHKGIGKRTYAELVEILKYYDLELEDD